MLGVSRTKLIVVDLWHDATIVSVLEFEISHKCI